MRYPAIVVFAAVLGAAGFAAHAKLPKRVHREGFSVIGMGVRTSNEREMKGEGVIAAQWQKWQKRYTARIKQPEVYDADGNLYAVYTDYASDRKGEYSFVIGVKADEDAWVPPGMVLKKIPAANYAVITSDKGPLDKVVVAAWQKVWTLEDNAGLGGKRAYKTDFELYDVRSADPQHSQVDLYVGLK